MGERTMVVVADGGGARVLIEVRRGGPLVEKTAALDLPKPHAAAGAAKGRVFDRFGHASHGVTHEPPHDKAERECLQELAELLPAIFRACTADQIVIMAPPRALGVLREALPAAVLPLIAQTEPRDRRHETLEELRAALGDLRRAAV